MGALALGIATFAVGAAQSVVSYGAQKAEYAANKENARQAWANNQTQLTLRAMQEEDALRQKQRQSLIEEAQVSAETQVSAAASGVAGISVENLLADVSRRAATNREVEKENTRMTLQQIREERKGINAKGQSQINSVAKPTGLSLVAGLGGAALSGATSYSKYSRM